jgi:hypothetical protein
MIEPRDQRPPLLRGAIHGAVVLLVGFSVVVTAPDGATGRFALAAGLMGVGSGLMILQVVAANRAGWRTVARRAVVAGGFGLAAAASYLAIGWVPLMLFIGVALLTAGWSQVQHLREVQG